MGNHLLDVGPLELQVLGILNAASGQSVTDIQTRLKESGSPLAYTTVMTVLVRLHKKGLATRQKNGRLFLYSVSKRKEASTFKIFERVKNTLFRSQRLQPILSLLDGDDELSREELNELKRAVEERLSRIKK